MARDPLATIHQRQDRDVRRLYATLGDALENAMVRLGDRDRPLADGDRQVIMREVDQALDIIWGAAPGRDSAMHDIILRDTDAARFAPLDATVKAWRRSMTPALRERLEAEARRDG